MKIIEDLGNTGIVIKCFDLMNCIGGELYDLERNCSRDEDCSNLEYKKAKISLLKNLQSALNDYVAHVQPCDED